MSGAAGKLTFLGRESCMQLDSGGNVTGEFGVTADGIRDEVKVIFTLVEELSHESLDHALAKWRRSNRVLVNQNNFLSAGERAFSAEIVLEECFIGQDFEGNLVSKDIEDQPFSDMTKGDVRGVRMVLMTVQAFTVEPVYEVAEHRGILVGQVQLFLVCLHES